MINVQHRASTGGDGVSELVIGRARVVSGRGFDVYGVLLGKGVCGGFVCLGCLDVCETCRLGFEVCY